MTQDKITTVIISESTKPNKKYQAEVNGKVIHFGAAGYSDFTHHKDAARKDRYIQRHKVNENFTKSGIATAGYLSRFVLWNKPSLKGSINDLNSKYKDVRFKMKP